jgi:hypothetical protein
MVGLFMKKISKKLYTILLTALLFYTLLIPTQAFAQTGTLGTESPLIKTTFTDSSQNQVDGNALEKGVYTVSIKLCGMKTVSIFQLTANYTDDISIDSVSTIADTDSSFSVGALINEDNSLIVAMASENDDASEISDEETMVTMTVTINTPGDFSDYFVVSTDPDLTFIEADYGDGFEAAYVFVNNEETDELYPLITVDVSPEISSGTITVSGKVVVAIDETGTTYYDGVVGINVYVGGYIDSNNNNKIVGGELVATTASDGTFTAQIPAGTQELIFDGKTTVPRKVTLNGDKDVSNAVVPIVICDYNHDGYINGSDSGEFTGYLDEKYIYTDINGDGDWNGSDMGSYSYFIGKTVDYADLLI